MKELMKPGKKIRVKLSDGRVVPAVFNRKVNTAAEINIKAMDYNVNCPQENCEDVITTRVDLKDMKEA